MAEVLSGPLTLCVDARVLSEYGEVLRRPRFGFDPDAVAVLLDFIARGGEAVASSPLAARLPDPDDEPFLEIAAASGAEALVTGNLAHFPPALRQGVRVLSPAAFQEAFRKGRQVGAGRP